MLNLKTIAFIILSFLIFTTLTYACDYSDADTLTENELAHIARRYDSNKVSSGVSMLMGDIVVTSVAIYNGKSGSSDGSRVDRMGTIYVDMTKCRIKSTLVGVFKTYDL